MKLEIDDKVRITFLCDVSYGGQPPSAHIKRRGAVIIGHVTRLYADGLAVENEESEFDILFTDVKIEVI